MGRLTPRIPVLPLQDILDLVYSKRAMRQKDCMLYFLKINKENLKLKFFRRKIPMYYVL